MRKFIFLVSVLLLPVICFPQTNVSPVYLSDISIIKYYKFDKPGANKDIYIQLFENITNINNYYPRHYSFFRFNYGNAQIISGTHNFSLENSSQLCAPGGYDYGFVNQFKVSARDTNIILRHIFPSTCFEPADWLSISNSNGTNWTNVYGNTFLSPTFGGLDIDPLTDSIMYYINRPPAGTNNFYRSTDKGQTWQPIYDLSSVSMPVSDNSLISVSCVNHSVVFFKTLNGLQRSSDFGVSFSPVTLPSVDIKSFEYDKVDNIIYFTSVGGTLGIFKSTDGGISWTRAFDKYSQSMEIDPLNNNILYAGSADGLYRSTDKGTTWSLYNNGFSPSKKVIGVSKSASMGDTLMVVTDKGIYKVYGAFRAFTENDYLPLKVGNSWTYIWTAPNLQTGIQKTTIIGDTIINNIKYFRLNRNFPGMNNMPSNLITQDSLSGNVFMYNTSSTCSRYANRTLIDSIAAGKNDVIVGCPNSGNGRCMDTIISNIFGSEVKSKLFVSPYISPIEVQHTYSQKFGITACSEIEVDATNYQLRGCTIDGIVYGDTSFFPSPYKTYLPLKVGNSWTYKKTVTDFPNPIITTYETVTIISDSIINGIKYYKTSENFPLYFGNLITLDSTTGNIFRYLENSGCPQYPNRFLLDSLGARVGNTIQSCPNTNTNGTATDTNNTIVFGQTVKSKGFLSPATSPVGISHRYSEKFGLTGAGASEGSQISYQLISCLIDGTFYSENSQTISGTVKFNDNSQPASNGYVKAIKLNRSNGSIITFDSVQIQSNGSYNLHNLPIDTCYIVAYPNSENQADFIPTYYPSAINWQNAVRVFTGSNPNNVNVSVLRKTNANGPYHVNGWIMPQASSLSGIKDAIVYIKQGNIFRDYFITQDAGSYNLDGLMQGDYQIITDRIGYMDSQANITIANSNLENINFYLIPVSVKNVGDIVPDKFNLYQNYPNPFNPVTNIKFDIPKSSFTTLKVYNVLGKEVAILLNEIKSAGSYQVDFDASPLSSGVYFYRIETERFTETKRMVILK